MFLSIEIHVQHNIVIVLQIILFSELFLENMFFFSHNYDVLGVILNLNSLYWCFIQFSSDLIYLYLFVNVLSFSPQDCWSHVNAEKIVFPKLWHVLRQGGEGNAVTIFPNLLPFVSKIPATASLDKDFFYNKFFTSMHHG